MRRYSVESNQAFEPAVVLALRSNHEPHAIIVHASNQALDLRLVTAVLFSSHPYVKFWLRARLALARYPWGAADSRDLKPCETVSGD